MSDVIIRTAGRKWARVEYQPNPLTDPNGFELLHYLFVGGGNKYTVRLSSDDVEWITEKNGSEISRHPTDGGAKNSAMKDLQMSELDFFVVKHYSSDEGPIIKGNGFDGLQVGEERVDAEEFVAFVNSLILKLKERGS